MSREGVLLSAADLKEKAASNVEAADDKVPDRNDLDTRRKVEDRLEELRLKKILDDYDYDV